MRGVKSSKGPHGGWEGPLGCVLFCLFGLVLMVLLLSALALIMGCIAGFWFGLDAAIELFVKLVMMLGIAGLLVFALRCTAPRCVSC